MTKHGFESCSGHCLGDGWLASGAHARTEPETSSCSPTALGSLTDRRAP